MPEIQIQDLINAMCENVAVVDDTGTILHVNTAWTNFSTLNSGQYNSTSVGANYFESVHQAVLLNDKYAQKVENGIQDILANKITSFELEYPCHGKNEHRWFIADIREIGSFTPRLFLFTHKNVTSLVEREEKVLEAQRLEAIGQLTSGMAHDFNNLLGIAMGNIELVQLKSNSGRDVEKYTENSLAAIRRGSSLIQKLLSFAREQNLKSESLEVNSFLNNMLHLVKTAVDENIIVQTNFSEQPVLAKVDEAMLTNAIINIAINAKHAMPKGGVLRISTFYKNINGEILLSGKEEIFGSYAVISISDTGSGIDEVDLAKVFEPFYTTKEIGEGSGLGLSMVFGFVKQSGGHIHISSEAGIGTTIFLYLPLASDYVLDTEAQDSSLLYSQDEKTVLVVEDNANMRETVSNMLKSIGYKVIQCGDSMAALEKLKSLSENIDVLLTDIIMPSEINGVELAKETRDTYPHIKILLMSGFPQHHMTEEESKLFPPVINKPFTLAELSEAIGLIDK